MNISVDEHGKVISFGTAVDGNLVVDEAALPEDFRDNAFWKYKIDIKSETPVFKSIKALLSKDGDIVNVGFDIKKGVDCPPEVALTRDFSLKKMVSKKWVDKEKELMDVDLGGEGLALKKELTATKEALKAALSENEMLKSGRSIKG